MKLAGKSRQHLCVMGRVGSLLPSTTQYLTGAASSRTGVDVLAKIRERFCAALPERADFHPESALLCCPVDQPLRRALTRACWFTVPEGRSALRTPAKDAGKMARICLQTRPHGPTPRDRCSLWLLAVMLCDQTKQRLIAPQHSHCRGRNRSLLSRTTPWQQSRDPRPGLSVLKKGPSRDGSRACSAAPRSKPVLAGLVFFRRCLEAHLSAMSAAHCLGGIELSF